MLLQLSGECDTCDPRHPSASPHNNSHPRKQKLAEALEEQEADTQELETVEATENIEEDILKIEE